MAANPHPRPTTVEEIFNDFKGRRAGIVRALTVDFKDFYQQCDPEKENLCLYGLPNETWEVILPLGEVPPVLLDPTVGINFARDGMSEKDWISYVAVLSDTWLISVAFYFGAHFGFGKRDRRRLFQMINGYPTIYEEVVKGAGKSTARLPSQQEEEDEQKTVLCKACGNNYGTDDFWICCDVCKGWYHGKCVKITPAEAQHIEQYKCPICSYKGNRF